MKMNGYKSIAIGILACLLASPAMAQVGELRNNWAIGVNGGLNMSSVSFEPSIKQQSKNGMAMGFTARYMCEKYFSMLCGIQAEVNYVEFPLLAHLAFGKDALDSGMRFFLNMGPQIGFFLSEKENMSDNWDTSARPNGITQQYGKMVENKFDYGILGGAGLEMSTGIGHFLLEGRYYYGLSDFWESTKKDFFTRSGHSYLGVRLTYLFDITK